MQQCKIKFYEIYKKNKIKYKNKIKKWICEIIKEESKNIKNAEIIYVLCDDEYLLELNQKFLKKNNYTDVIAFDYSEGDMIHGEVYISYERIKENAKKYRKTSQEELRKIIAHGTLHLLGYKDKNKTEKILMEKKEDYYTNQFENCIKEKK